MTEPEKKARVKQMKITKAKSKLKMTDEQTAESLAKDRKHKAEQQQSLTESERTVRRHKNKAAKSVQRSALRHEEKKKNTGQGRET